jgi:hypothetical protein
MRHILLVGLFLSAFPVVGITAIGPDERSSTETLSANEET